MKPKTCIVAGAASGIGGLPGNPGEPPWMERIPRFAPSPEQMAETCVHAALDETLRLTRYINNCFTPMLPNSDSERDVEPCIPGKPTTFGFKW